MIKNCDNVTKLFWIYCLSSVLILSCNRNISLEGRAVNNYGGYERNNNYEEFGDFYRQLFYNDDYKVKDSSGVIAPLLSLSSSKTVFATKNGSIILLEGKQSLWEAKLDEGSVAASGMAADAVHNIYVMDNKGSLYSFEAKGKLRWKRDFLGVNDSSITVFSDLLSTEDGIFAASSDGYLAKYNFDGKVIWSKQFSLHILKYFAVDKNGNIALVLTHNIFGESDSLLLIDKKGIVKFSKSFANTRIIKPAIIKDDKIYLCCIYTVGETRLPLVYVIRNNGDIVLRKEINQMPRFISVDNDKNIYIVAYDGGFGQPLSAVLCLDSTGKKLWDKYFEVNIPAPVMISKNVISFTGAAKEAYGIYFLSKGGFLEKVISLSEAPMLSIIPTVTPSGNIIFAGTEKLQIIRIDDTPMKKIVPW